MEFNFLDFNPDVTFINYALPCPQTPPPPLGSIVFMKLFRSPYRMYRMYDRTWISNKRKGFS